MDESGIGIMKTFLYTICSIRSGFYSPLFYYDYSNQPLSSR